MVTKTQGVARRRSNRLDVNLSVPAHAALTRRTCLEVDATRALVTNSIVSRYADLMAEYHATIETKFNTSEIEALRGVIDRGKHLTFKTLWRQDRATCKMDFARAVRHASDDIEWTLSRTQTNKLLRILESILSTEEYFGLIDYLSLDPSLQKVF